MKRKISDQSEAMSVAKLTLAEFFQTLRKPRIVGLCGSQRIGSFNKILHDTALEKLEKEGAIVSCIDLESLNLPLYNPNLEKEHFPESAKTLKSALIGADGIFIACPEYNGFVSPLLLNAITWATRGEGDMYAGFKSKVVSLMSTSPGPMGGMRMLRSLQQMLQDMGAVVIPGNTAIGNAYQVFKDGKIVDERSLTKVVGACHQLVLFARYVANSDHQCAVAQQVMKLQNMGEYGKVDLP